MLGVLWLREFRIEGPTRFRAEVFGASAFRSLGLGLGFRV